MPRSPRKTIPALEKLEALYALYNRRCYVHPDPLEFLYRFPDPRDREIVALIASSLAYGKVEQILKSVSAVLGRMNGSPFLYLSHTTLETMQGDFSDFRHRFTPGADLSLLLWSGADIIRKHGSLQSCFLAGYRKKDETVLPALASFVDRLHRGFCCSWKGFLPSPAKGSACKRLNLFLRWLVREDEVDPGGWGGIPSSKLLVPLDTHMHRIGLMLGLTKRRQADLSTAIEITKAFSALSPEDPVRYDFVLTRFGIRNDMDGEHLKAICGEEGEKAYFPRTHADQGVSHENLCHRRHRLCWKIPCCTAPQGWSRNHDSDSFSQACPPPAPGRLLPGR